MLLPSPLILPPSEISQQYRNSQFAVLMDNLFLNVINSRVFYY